MKNIEDPHHPLSLPGVGRPEMDKFLPRKRLGLIPEKQWLRLDTTWKNYLNPPMKYAKKLKVWIELVRTWITNFAVIHKGVATCTLGSSRHVPTHNFHKILRKICIKWNVYIFLLFNVSFKNRKLK